jgi:hypothetical protein
MKILRHALRMTGLVLAVAMLFPGRVYGYIDPGTGSYIFQIVIAAFVAVSFAVKVYWNKIKKFVSGLFSRKNGVQ